LSLHSMRRCTHLFRGLIVLIKTIIIQHICQNIWHRKTVLVICSSFHCSMIWNCCTMCVYVCHICSGGTKAIFVMLEQIVINYCMVWALSNVITNCFCIVQDYRLLYTGNFHMVIAIPCNMTVTMHFVDILIRARRAASL